MNIEQTLMERAKYWYPRVWQREMWQNILLRVQQNICYESFCEQNICKSDSLCLSLLISGFIQSFLKYRDDDGTYVDNIQQQSPRTVAVTHDRHTAGVLVEHNTK